MADDSGKTADFIEKTVLGRIAAAPTASGRLLANLIREAAECVDRRLAEAARRPGTLHQDSEDLLATMSAHLDGAAQAADLGDDGLARERLEDLCAIAAAHVRALRANPIHTTPAAGTAVATAAA